MLDGTINKITESSISYNNIKLALNRSQTKLNEINEELEKLDKNKKGGTIPENYSDRLDWQTNIESNYLKNRIINNVYNGIKKRTHKKELVRSNQGLKEYRTEDYTDVEFRERLSNEDRELYDGYKSLDNRYENNVETIQIKIIKIGNSQSQ